MIPGVSKHARDRMQERHGRDLTRAEWTAAVVAILDRRAVLLHSGTAGEVYAIPVGGVTLRMVWRPDLGLVATVLTDGIGISKTAHKARCMPVGRRRPNEH